MLSGSAGREAPVSRLSRFIVWSSLALASCADAEPSPELVVATFRDLVAIDVSPPAANAPVVASLVPGAPFQFGDRYYHAKQQGVGPNMARFLPTNVGTIPSLRSGDIVAVTRNGQVSRTRLVGVVGGLVPGGAIISAVQASPPFTPTFEAVPWSAWNANAAAMHACADAVAAEAQPCIDVTGNSAACSDAAADQLGECASGQDYTVPAAYGEPFDIEFECLLPPPHSQQVIDMDMSMGPCAGSFSGIITYESGDFGCEEVYTGTWSADDPDCNAGPADVIILDGAS